MMISKEILGHMDLIVHELVFELHYLDLKKQSTLANIWVIALAGHW